MGGFFRAYGAHTWGTMIDKERDDDDLLVEERDDEDEADSEPDSEPDTDEKDEDEGDDSDDEGEEKPPKQLSESERKKKARETNKRIHSLLQDRWQLSTKVGELESELSRIRGESVHTGVTGAEAELDRIERDLSQAVEDGDTKSVVELQRKHSQAVYKLEQRRTEQERYPKPDENQRPQQQRMQPHPRVLEWGERVGAQSWTPAELQIAHAVDVQLTSEGFNPDDDDFWIEADERLSHLVPKRMEHARKFQPGQRRTAEKRRSRPPMTPTRGGKPQAGRGLTSEERKMMRDGGWNPDSDADRKLFLKYGRE